MKADEYDDLALRVLRDVLRRESAMIGSEAEAKISDSKAPGAPLAIDPHHVTNARRMLATSGELEIERTRTRGGHLVETFSLAETPRSEAKEASSRKRSLYSRYLGWATGTRRYPNGLIGPAAERIVDRALHEAAATGAGYRIVEKSNRGVDEVLGRPVPGGPLDAAAFHVALDDRGVPTRPTLIPIEVKNLRSWIYPAAAELYQLLDKSAQIQVANPDIAIVPTFVCRRAHKTTFRMAKHLGFYVIDARRQYILPSPDVKRGLEEIREVFGFRDIMQWEQDPYLARHFSTSLPSVAARAAERWAETASRLHQLFSGLRRTTLSSRDRHNAMAALRRIAQDLPGEFPTGW